MKRNLSRLAAVGVTTLVASGLVVSVAGSASAATALGQAIPSLASGTTADLWNIKTSAPCPAGSPNVRAVINSVANGWTNVGLLGNGPIGTIDMVNTGKPISGSLDSIAASNSLQVKPGAYTLTVFCQNTLGTTVSGQFDGTITVSGTAGTAAMPYVYNAPAAPASTTTLNVTPASPVTSGANVTLTAAVTSTATVAGSVDFFDGATKIGTSAVSGGTASFSTTTLSTGTHSLTAKFVPTDAASIAASTSSAVSFQVNGVAAATTTTGSFSPASPTTADLVTLTADVAPVGAAGTVTFTEGASIVGSSAVAGGKASISLSNLTAGAHNYTAAFVPTDPTAFVASTSAAFTVNVTAFAGVTNTQQITTTVAAGTLTITGGGGTVDLGPATLDATNTVLATAPKDMNPVTVTDTRAGAPGYSVNGVAGDFTGANGTINSENLGWTPKVIGTVPAGVTAGADVLPGNGVAVGATTGAGLKTPRLLGKATAGNGIGTAQFGAALTLKAPTTTKAGTYSTTLTITAI